MAFKHASRAFKEREGTNLDNDGNNEDGPFRRAGSSEDYTQQRQKMY